MLTIYAAPDVAQRLSSVCPDARIRAAPRRPLLWRLVWEQLFLPIAARKVDVVYAPGNFALFLSPRPQVLTLQNPHHFGSRARQVRSRCFGLSGRLRLALESAVARASVRRADEVIAISQTMRESVEEDLGPVPFLRVVPSAAPVLPSVGAWVGPSVAPAPYVVSVANDYPHKDWDGLVAAFAANVDLPPLVLVGQPRDRHRIKQLQQQVPDLDRRVDFRGPVADRHLLAAILRGARCCVAHSLLESFDFSPYEAMSQGLPVVTSDIPAHREVCGPYAGYYRPDSLDDLANAVRTAVRRRRSCSGGRYWQRTWHDNAVELASALLAARYRQPRHH